VRVVDDGGQGSVGEVEASWSAVVPSPEVAGGGRWVRVGSSGPQPGRQLFESFSGTFRNFPEIMNLIFQFFYI
jgi:hypothetical protein